MKHVILCIAAFTVMLTTSIAQIPNYVPSNGLIGYWGFTGNSNDESVTGNNGTVNGATLTTDRFGNPNSAYDFDGVDDYIEIPDHANYAFGNTDFSVNYWVNKQDSVNSGSSSSLFDNAFDVSKWNSANGSGTNEWVVGLSGPQVLGNPNIANRPRFWVESGTTIYRLEGETEMTQFLDEWVMITAIRELDSIFIFLNGAYEASMYIGNASINQSGAAIILAALSPSYLSIRSETQIDELGIWNRALTPCEVQELYTGQVSSINTSVSTSGITTFCQGGDVQLTAPAGYDYMWSTNEITQSIVVNSTGTYTVEVIDGACSETSQSVSVTVLSNPTVSLSPFSAICENALAIPLSGGSPSGGSFTVNGNSATELDPSVTGSGAQTIAYTYTDQNNCSGSASQNAMVNGVPNVTLSGLNTSYSLSDNPTVLTATPSGGFFNGNGVANGMFDPAAAGLGTHGIMYTVVDGNGCVGGQALCTTVDLNVNVGGSNIGTDGGGIDVYPNPSNGLFSITVDGIDGIINMIVYDSRGREIISESMVLNGQKSINDIDLNNYSDGVYTLQLSSKSGNYTTKLVKK
ncbi:T9SS type A sorting domain-containing protein [Flavobacteriales bacterium]|nr:T9SS type A sorting domain-containing protein [Flavobacteriales bacterium]